MESFFSESSLAPTDSKLEAQLKTVFSTPVWGFREILLVMTIARLLDPKYRPSTGFYDCNPRALYEGPIRKVLAKYNIPHRKSGPLNVAKAAVGINKQWSAQRRPAEVAAIVVILTKQLEKFSEDELDNFGKVLAGKFLLEANRVADLIISMDPKTDPLILSTLCKDLIEAVPDAGNTPQRICGLLLESYHQKNGKIKITGHEDRASATSTTSKKPGDINEETSEGKVLLVYEITVKSFNLSRMTESYETVKAYNTLSGESIQEVFVVCRKADSLEILPDSEDGKLLIGKFEYQDMTYYFLDIHQWVIGNLLRMPVDSRKSFFTKLNDYVSHPNTAEKVKVFWKEAMSKLLSE
jgi:hypothetical protein